MSAARSDDAFEYVCRCGWEGGDPLFDAHYHAWCPQCGRPADFKLPG